ncbi:BTAD domain-containing putative transcriptional regulator, partial [Dactylosporangium sp. NPDC050588]|uniref:BTAD domain-containing putative transcriptional regulator n=1 Tax=Dactylosporangium sp. NPDC050588 TaxID=3157211 RepID=UPI0033E27E2F
AIPGAAHLPEEPQALAAALGGEDRPPTLVIVDDLHRLAAPDAEQALETLLVRAPAWLHVLAAGRRMPGLNLARYELADVSIVDGEQLRFRSWEAERLLREVYREPLPPDDVAALARRLGGWAAGLHMFHLSTHNRPLVERRRAVAALDGRQALTRAYLAHTVLAELPVPLREFLLRTSVFDVLTPQRCERLLDDGGGSREHLAELERRQAFTASTDGGRSYRYHEVLRAHLAVTLAERFGEAGARALHARAATLLAEEGALVEAVRAAARAEDWDQVRALLDRLGGRAADDPGDGTEPWQDLLPEWLVAEDPWLMLAKGRHLLARGRIEAAVLCLRAAEEHFFDEQGRGLCRAGRRLAALWAPGGATLPGHYAGELRAATRRAPAEVAATTREPLVRAAARLLAGDPDGARRALPPDPPASVGVADLGVRLLHACLDVAGAWPAARGELDRLAADAEWAGQPWIVRMARALGAFDGTAQGLTEARAAVAECDRDGDRWGAALAQALVCLVGTPVPATDDAAELLRHCAALDAPVLRAWAESLLSVAQAAAGDPDAPGSAARAERLARDAGVPAAAALAAAAASRATSNPTGGPDTNSGGSTAHQSGGHSRTQAGAGDRDAGSGGRHTPTAGRRDATGGGAGAGAAGHGGRETGKARRGGAGHEAAGIARVVEAGLPATAVLRWLGERPGGDPATAAQAPPVEVYCLGGFQLRLHGRELDLAGVKPRTRVALRLLAMHAGRPLHRETMLEALWPGVATASATRSLHVTLSSLRAVLPPQPRLLSRDGDAYELTLPPGGYSDIGSFAAALREARRAAVAGDGHARAAALHEALFAYGGELLPEDGPAEWVVHEREVLRRRAAEAATELATALLATGETADAVAAAERCVQIDRYCDAGWRLVVDGYRQLGNLAAAARARREYAHVLASLDATPAH